MLYFFRLFAVITYFFIFSFIVILYLSFRPFKPNNAHKALKLFKPAHWLAGINVICVKEQPEVGTAIYIANHQNLLDIFLIGKIWPKNASVIGKKSLMWIPLFGPAYWLAGNIFINRGDKRKAWALVDQVVEHLQQEKRSFLFMPEGTRSKGRGLLPFKKGAFAAAIKAGVPIVPLCCSSATMIDLKQWHVKPAYVSYLEPISTIGLTVDDSAELAQRCHDLMKEKIAELDQMVNDHKLK
ncbi:MAG: 1-acylglycerol-3-phosphate O-acyltransferase [Pseudomonadales bacterium]|nr:1-acylglycerol-3-phosphate O-acyltransferase [Pseudomonadales bacterium]